MKPRLLCSLCIAALVVLTAPLSAQPSEGNEWFTPRTSVLSILYEAEAPIENHELPPAPSTKSETVIKGALIGAAIGFVGSIAFNRVLGDDDGIGFMFGLYIGAPVGAVLGGLAGLAEASAADESG